MNDPRSTWTLKPTRTLTTLLAAAFLLAACGTNTPKEAEPEPAPTLTIESVSPNVAVAGETVVVVGKGLGQDGNVRVGDVLAHTVSWSDERVVIAIPQAAQPAWQPLTVASSGNGEGQAELFVGHAFTDAPTDFQRFLDSLPAGAHVLLPAGTLELAGQDIALKGVHLYGAPAGTSLELGTGSLALVVGAASATSLNGLAVNADLVGYRAALDGTNVLSPGWVNTAVTLREVAFQGRQFGEQLSEPAIPLVAGDLEVVDSRFTASGGAALVGHPHVVVTASRAVAPDVTVASLYGDAKVTSSQLLGVTATVLRGARDVELVGSTARSSNGGVEFRASPPAENPNPSFRPRVHVATSVVEALNDPAVAGSSPYLDILVEGGDVEIVDNERLYARADIEIDVYEGRRVLISGNDEISVGRLDASVPDDHLSGRFDLWLDSIGPYEIEVTGNTVHFEYTVSVNAESDEIPTDGPSGTNLLTIADNVLRSTGLRDSSIDVEARGSHATHCVISGNVMEITAPEENHDVTLECLPDDQAVELVVTQNRIAVAGTQSDARIDSTGTGTTIITDNTIGVGESLTLGADGNPLTVLNNQLSANRITLSRRYAGNTPTRFSFNNVSATEVGNYMLRVRGEGTVDLTGNTVEQVAATSPDSVALYVVAIGQLEVSAHQNVFTNFGRALRFEAEGSSIEGTLNNNVFDFPMEVAPDAVNVSALIDSSVVLDLRDNRWGQVESPGQLDDLITVTFDATSTVSLDFSTVLTE